MSPELATRLRSFADSLRARIAAGAIECPGDGSRCQNQIEYFDRHVRDCPRGEAIAELYRVERELEAERHSLCAHEWCSHRQCVAAKGECPKCQR